MTNAPVPDCSPDDLVSADRLIARIDDLHSAPQIVQKVLQLLRDPDFNIREIAVCIERDPALTTKVLRTVNSSRFGLRHRISSIQQAASYVGQRSLRMIALTFGLVETLTRGAAGGFYVDYWRRTLTMATVAARLARRGGIVAPDDAYTAGLLADVGCLVLAQSRDFAYLAVCAAPPHGPELVDVERRAFGFGHPVLGARLLARWDLPGEVVCAVEHHHIERSHPQPLETLVRAGDLMADVLWTPNSPRVQAAKSLLSREFRLTTDDFIDLALNCRRDIDENAELFGVQLGGMIDCDELMSAARRLHVSASLETALEFDSLVVSLEDESA